jgi:hypothetical protein
VTYSSNIEASAITLLTPTTQGCPAAVGDNDVVTGGANVIRPVPGGEARRRAPDPPLTAGARRRHTVVRPRRPSDAGPVRSHRVTASDAPHLRGRDGLRQSASLRRKSSPVRDVMEFRAVAMLKCGRAGSGQLVGLTAIASIEIRASGIGRATLGDDRAGFGSAENARV